MGKEFYVTTPIYYVNAEPHIGHAYTTILADFLKRFYLMLGYDTFFLTGTDEHGDKIVKAAAEKNVSVEDYTDKISNIFRQTWIDTGIAFDDFIRTTEERHKRVVSEILQKVYDSGDIYFSSYGGYYCYGCERYLTDKDMVDGKCPEHNRVPETVSEENYFFKLSRYQKQLEDLIASDKLKVFPQNRKNETLGFIRQGLEDFSVSRPAERLGNWGIPVPSDPNQVMYVWFDALTIYMTAIGWGYDETIWKKWWPADIHVIGKGIYRFHTVYWPAMLLSAGLPLPKSILVHGYVNSGGQKMAKSLGNVLDPEALLKKYGADPMRYYLLKEIPTQADGDFTEARFKEIYNADLANGLGNLVSRVLTMAEKFCGGKVPPKIDLKNHPLRKQEVAVWKTLEQKVSAYEFHLALEAIWNFIHGLDKYIDEVKPWMLAKENKQAEIDAAVYALLDCLKDLTWQIAAFLPDTAQKIGKALNLKGLLAKTPVYKDSWTNLVPGTKIKPIKPLFPRI